MQPVATTWFFYGLSAIAVVSALLVITRRNPVHSAISLIITLLSLAGLYLMLYAPFVAGVQIILYVGGIMVLFLFVIMLVNIERNLREEQFNKQWLVAGLATLVLGALLVYVYMDSQKLFPAFPAPMGDIETANTQRVGMALYTTYVYPFEIASILLLVAIIGAVVMAKKRI
jgi:NADH-quinone oxidoreductase subunit J